MSSGKPFRQASTRRRVLLLTFLLKKTNFVIGAFVSRSPVPEQHSSVIRPKAIRYVSRILIPQPSLMQIRRIRLENLPVEFAVSFTRQTCHQAAC